MKFTARTYRKAIKRSFKQEYYFFAMHTKAYSGPHKWFNQMQHTNRLRKRRAEQRTSKMRTLLTVLAFMAIAAITFIGIWNLPDAWERKEVPCGTLPSAALECNRVEGSNKWFPTEEKPFYGN